MIAHLVQPNVLIEENDSRHTDSTEISQGHDNTASNVVPLRRSRRQSHRPGWLDDFIFSTSDPSLLLHCDSAYSTFVASLSILQEPSSFAEAVKHVEWQDAMKTKLDALERNCTWKLTPLPMGKKPIGCKWVFKTKLRADGTIERYKARLVAKGFNQIAGVDYNDNFSPSAHDHYLLTQSTSDGLLALLVYVDDILVTAPTVTLIQQVKDYLHNLFTIKDLGSARYFLGLEIARNSEGMLLNTSIYKISSGTLGTATKGSFLLSDSSCELHAYCDADWASCTDSRRSLTGFCVFFVNALISWKTKKQSIVSRSTAEAEYRSMAATVCELRWLSYLLSDLGIFVRLPIRLFCDNQAAMHIMANPVFHERTKHIELDCHVVRDACKDGFITPSFVRSSVQIADIFTKSLGLKSFVSLLSKLGLVVLQPSPTCGGMLSLYILMRRLPYKMKEV
ncbi:UNVERIFIED_CONTAM: Retrovirus-related Pol polyprotein from transposon RE2 [Sesamum radiatum]|uniref:Retrovirus-related Pol polyprotein from transposon RE2 n=1 Tax=Sesamum radiatum TaxID=300843 RepID=A0AAW2T904_SESRA